MNGSFKNLIADGQIDRVGDFNNILELKIEPKSIL
jgi:hypothetical protein